MHLMKRVVLAVGLLIMSACGGAIAEREPDMPPLNELPPDVPPLNELPSDEPPPCQPPPPPAEDAAHLGAVHAYSQGCRYTLSYSTRVVPDEPHAVTVYDISIERTQECSCLWASQSTWLMTSYTLPALSIAATDKGVAVSYTNKTSWSTVGSNYIPRYLNIKHIAPDTLATVRDVQWGAWGCESACPPAHIYSGQLSFPNGGDTLRVDGTKSGIIRGETGSGNSFSALLPSFFTSTTAPSIQASP